MCNAHVVMELFQEDTHFYIKRYPHANVEYSTHAKQ